MLCSIDVTKSPAPKESTNTVIPDTFSNVIPLIFHTINLRHEQRSVNTNEERIGANVSRLGKLPSNDISSLKDRIELVMLIFSSPTISIWADQLTSLDRLDP